MLQEHTIWRMFRDHGNHPRVTVVVNVWSPRRSAPNLELYHRFVDRARSAENARIASVSLLYETLEAQLLSPAFSFST